MSRAQVQLPNNRRITVDVWPNRCLSELLIEACERSGYDAADVRLTFHSRPIDESLPWRLAGLPANCVLEMQPHAHAAKHNPACITLQAAGARHSVTCSPDVTLRQLLQQADAEHGLSLLTPDTPDAQPTLTHTSKTYATEPVLSTLTLRHLGVRGGARELLRYDTRSMKQEEVSHLAQDCEVRAAKRSKWMDQFDAKKQANEQRALVETQRDQEIERLRFEQEAARERAAEEQRAQQQQQRQEQENKERKQVQFVNGAAGGGGGSGGADGPQPTEQQQQQETRLGRLQNLLQQVEGDLTSQDEHTFDFARNAGALVQGVAAQARQHLQQQPQPNRPQLQMQPDFSNFKFPEPSSSSTGSSTTKTATTTSSSSPSDSQSAMEAESSPMTSSSSPPSDRQLCVFAHAELSAKRLAAEDELTDAFFELDTQDVQRRHKELCRSAAAETNRALLPVKAVASENARRRADAMRHTTLRVTFGRSKVLQANFNSAEPVSRVHELLRAAVSALAGRPFKLLLPPALHVPDSPTRSLLDVQLAPRCTLTCVYALNDGESLEQWFSSASLRTCSLAEADAIVDSWLAANSTFVQYAPTVADGVDAVLPTVDENGMALPADHPSRRRVVRPGGAVPKWFGGGGKR